MRHDREDKGREVRSGIAKAFRALRKQGYVAKAHFSCCGSCGTAELGMMNPLPTKWVFFHRQGSANLRNRGEVRVVWGDTVENGQEIAKAFTDAGLTVDWNRTVDETIGVSLPKAKPEFVLVGEF